MKPEPKFCPTCGLAVDIDQRLAQRELELHQARAALADLIGCAEAAMRDANLDGAGYDVEGELDDARAALAGGEA